VADAQGAAFEALETFGAAADETDVGTAAGEVAVDAAAACGWSTALAGGS